jgi:dTDP-4-amino-4,6-dideoxygalactose transaminase
MASKSRLEDLAIVGGPAAFPQPLHVGRPNVGDRVRLLERINDLLDRRWFTNDGPYVRELERELVRLIGVRHCVAVCNGTIALELAIRAAELSGEVIVPAFTFVATAHALQWQGITPVFADIDASTHNIDPSRVESLINERTSGILGVHVWGRPCNVQALGDIARRHRLALLFDAAHGLGCSHGGRMLGSFGDAEVLSFHATKSVTTFEGGAVATNDDGLAARVRAMRNFGFAGEDQVTSLGINGKMSEVAAAMGLTSLESMAEVTAANHRNYALYRRQLADVPGVQFVGYDESEQHNYQFIVLEVDAATSHLSRDELRDVLRAEGVLARRYFYPGCHRMEPYRSSATVRLLPSTDAVAARVLSLPMGTAVRLQEIEEICQIICLAVAGAYDLRARGVFEAPRATA